MGPRGAGPGSAIHCLLSAYPRDQVDDENPAYSSHTGSKEFEMLGQHDRLPVSENETSYDHP